jgi:TPR repeat protein
MRKLFPLTIVLAAAVLAQPPAALPPCRSGATGYATLSIQKLRQLDAQQDPAAAFEIARRMPGTAEGVQALSRAADRGVCDAELAMAGMLFERDQAKAVQFLRSAAGKGHPVAQYNFAVCYHHGDSVERNIPEAARWYERAARQGHVKAQRNIGMMYYFGTGVTQDPEKGKQYFRLAAAQGDGMALQALADLARGLRLPRPADFE